MFAKSRCVVSFKAGVLGRKEIDSHVVLHSERDSRPSERSMVEKIATS